MFRKDNISHVPETAGGSSTPVARYQAMQNSPGSTRKRKTVSETEGEDFHSLLSAVAGEESEKESVQDGSHKNLNISSVISQIKDEGPASTRERSASPTTEEWLAEQKHKEAETANGQQPEPSPATQKVSPPTMEDLSAQIRSVVEELLAARQQEPASRQNHRGAWILPGIFLCLLLAGAYALYKTSNELALARASISQLSSRIYQAEETLGGVRRELSANRDRFQGLVTSQQLQEQMIGYQDRIQREVLERMRLDWILPGQVVPPMLEAGGKTVDFSQKADVQEPDTSLPRSAAPPEAATEMPVKSRQKGVGKGEWDLYLASYANESKARKALEKYIDQVPNAVIQPALVKGKQVYRIAVPGFVSKTDASRQLARIKKQLGLKGSWLGRHSRS